MRATAHKPGSARFPGKAQQGRSIALAGYLWEKVAYIPWYQADGRLRQLLGKGGIAIEGDAPAATLALCDEEERFRAAVRAGRDEQGHSAKAPAPHLSHAGDIDAGAGAAGAAAGRTLQRRVQAAVRLALCSAFYTRKHEQRNKQAQDTEPGDAARGQRRTCAHRSAS